MATLSAEYKKMLMAMSPDDITASFIFEYLADRAVNENGKVKVIPSKIKTSDTFTLKAKEYNNDKEVLTNVGLFIYNKFLFEESLYKVVGYVNEPVTADVQKSIEGKLSAALLNDTITSQEFATYLDKTQWLSMQFNSVFSSSFTMNTIRPIPKVMKKKEELIKQHKDEIDSGDVTAAFNIEQELISMAKEELKDDPGMNLYNSGARGSINNNLKANTIIKGPVFNPATNKWDFVESNFTDGIKKEEIASYGNSVVTGAYPKAVGTQVSGYLTKELTAAFQDITISDEEDCGTNLYLEVLVNNWNKKDILYRYIKEGSKLVLLDSDNIDKYVGKTVKMRSIMFCKNKTVCKTCAGKMFELLGIKNIGLTTAKLSGALLNMNMKKFHNSTVNINPIDLSDLTL